MKYEDFKKQINRLCDRLMDENNVPDTLRTAIEEFLETTDECIPEIRFDEDVKLCKLIIPGDHMTTIDDEILVEEGKWDDIPLQCVMHCPNCNALVHWGVNENPPSYCKDCDSTFIYNTED